MFDLLCIVGPTASGKTNLAVRLAAAFGGEIISADSRQVYRGMDIGTGKDLDEYVWEGKKIPYHLIDVVEAGYKYNVFEYQSDFVKVWEDCRQRGVLPVLCGGSGLYVEDADLTQKMRTRGKAYLKEKGSLFNVKVWMKLLVKKSTPCYGNENRNREL